MYTAQQSYYHKNETKVTQHIHTDHKQFESHHIPPTNTGSCPRTSVRKSDVKQRQHETNVFQ
jgi:hypothetical protein